MDKTSRRTFVLDLRKRVLYEHGWSLGLGCSEIGDEDRNAEEYAARERSTHNHIYNYLRLLGQIYWLL